MYQCQCAIQCSKYVLLHPHHLLRSAFIGWVWPSQASGWEQNRGDEGSWDRGLGQRPPLWLEANQSKLAKLQSRCSPIRITATCSCIQSLPSPNFLLSCTRQAGCPSLMFKPRKQVGKWKCLKLGANRIRAPCASLPRDTWNHKHRHKHKDINTQIEMNIYVRFVTFISFVDCLNATTWWWSYWAEVVRKTS